MTGRTEVATYLHNYAHTSDWQFALGLVEGRLVVLVRDPRDVSRAPTYFVLLEWEDDRLLSIRDFRYARYVIDGAELSALD